MSNQATLKKNPVSTKPQVSVKNQIRQELQAIKKSLGSQPPSTRVHLQGRFIVK